MDKDMIEYEQRVLPDKKTLSAVLREAKGEERTMAQLAEACETSASSLSRILTGKITKPLSMELLKAIAANSASPSVTLEVLARANGMRPKGEYSPHSMMGRNPRYAASKDRETSVKNLISNTLLSRECEIRVSTGPRLRMNDDNRKESAFGLPIRWSCLIRTDAFKTKRIENWGIITDTSVADESDAEERRRYNLYSMGRFCAPIFLSDLWEPDLYQDTKITFAFVDSFYYNEFVQTYGSQKVNNCISAMLIDLQKGEISEEKAFQRINGETCPLLQDIPEVEYDEKMQDFPWTYMTKEDEHPWIYKDQDNENK